MFMDKELSLCDLKITEDLLRGGMQDRTEERNSAGEKWQVETGCPEAASPLFPRGPDDVVLTVQV